MSIVVAVITFFLDQFLKHFVRSRMAVWSSITLIPGVVRISYVHNVGAAFGILPNRRLFFIVVSILLLAVSVWWYRSTEPHSTWLKIGYGLLLGGAMGNLWDRVRSGYVTDFIDLDFWPLKSWPVFNIADMALVTAISFYFIYLIREVKEKRHEDNQA